MKTILTHFVLICATIALATACQQSSSDAGKDDSAKQEGNLTDDNWTDAQVDSENLTDDAESILAIDTLDQALAKLTEALKLNPANARADVWVSFIKLELESKGILARVRPFVESMPDGEYEYQKLLDNQSGDQELLRRFYLDGPNDIHTPDEFQEWIDRVDLRLTELRETFSKHKSEQLRLLVPLNAFATVKSSSTGPDCRGKSWGPIKYQPSDCSTTAAEFLLNRTDIEAVTSVISSYQAGLAVMNAYRYSQAAINKMKSKIFYEDGTEWGILIRDGAKLRSQQNMKVASDDMRDFAVAVRYIMDHQKEACPRGYESSSNRKGYLFTYGFCVNSFLPGDDAKTRTVQLINQILNRKPLTLTAHETTESIDVDADKFFSTPIDDLHAFDPLHKTACNEYEPTFTPLKAYVPRGDLDKFMIEAGYSCGAQYLKNGGTFKW